MRIRYSVALVLAVAVTFATFLVTPLYPADGNAHGWPLAWYSTPEWSGWIPWLGPWLGIAFGSFNIMGFALDLAFWFTAIYVSSRLVATENES